MGDHILNKETINLSDTTNTTPVAFGFAIEETVSSDDENVGCCECLRQLLFGATRVTPKRNKKMMEG